jgi:DNA-binding transcriptional ArsR family regulator
MSPAGMALDHEALARVLAVLAHPVRLRILETLLAACGPGSREDGCCVSEINRRVSVTQPVLSKHLKVLREAGILRFHRRGNRVIHGLETGGPLGALVTYLQGLETCCGLPLPPRPANTPQRPPARPEPRSMPVVLL